VYERSGGQTTLVSTGPAGGNGDPDAEFVGSSEDGGRTFFLTEERMVSADTDAFEDVYQRSGGQTTLVSTGPAGGNGAFDIGLVGLSADGTRVFLETDESMMSGDTDTFQDVYVKRVAAPVNSARPRISGTPLIGRRLSCSPGLWSNTPTSLTFRWNRGGMAIPGATSPSYILTRPDGARPVTCTVVAANAGGSRSATSAPVTPRFPGACSNVQTGGAGPDRLTGLALGDVLRGLGGNDLLTGRAGDDCLSGGPGNDTLAGGTGNDRFDAGLGDDAVNARDQRSEIVNCGPGRQDRVIADRNDRLIGCENVRRP
jgi:hypothetical protein